MGRKAVGGDIVHVRFPDGTLDRIDARSDGSRSEFIRDAVLRTLNGLDGNFPLGSVVASEPEKKSDGLPLEDRIIRATAALDAKYPKKAVSDDREVLLALVLKKALSERQAMEALGWMELRVSKVAGKLAGSGLIRYRDGLMEAV